MVILTATVELEFFVADLLISELFGDHNFFSEIYLYLPKSLMMNCPSIPVFGIAIYMLTNTFIKVLKTSFARL